jgi:hypothetical protein
MLKLPCFLIQSFQPKIDKFASISSVWLKNN